MFTPFPPPQKKTHHTEKNKTKKPTLPLCGIFLNNIWRYVSSVTEKVEVRNLWVYMVATLHYFILVL